MVNAGKNYIGNVVDGDLEKLVKEGEFSASADFSRIREVVLAPVFVSTPLD